MKRSGRVSSLDIRPGHPLSLDIRPGSPLLVTSGGGHWRPVQTCTFAHHPISPPQSSIIWRWPLKLKHSTVSKRVRILLHRFLVTDFFTTFSCRFCSPKLSLILREIIRIGDPLRFKLPNMILSYLILSIVEITLWQLTFSMRS